MTIPFYKLQLAGNGFILIDLEALSAHGLGDTGARHSESNGRPSVLTEGQSPDPATGGEKAAEQHERLEPDRYAAVARRFCDRRYGVGATAVIFLSKDNTVRIFNAQGLAAHEADDALLCAARFSFDTGRAKNHAISFQTPQGEKKLDVLGAHEFRLAIGSPFALLGGHVIQPDSATLVETIERDGLRASCSALHIHDDAVVAFPRSDGAFSYAGFSALVQKTFPGKNVLPVIARSVTRETILVRAIAKRESGACTAAAASLVSAICAGTADTEAVVMFEHTGSDGQPDAVIARDRDNSRRLAVIWDTKQNELYVIGSGGYLFEGKFDIPPDEIN